MNKKYYIPISSVNLADYFGSACISPSKYLSSKPNDIQDLADNCLLITNFIGGKGSDCCLEIVLSNEEEKKLDKISQKAFLFPKPLAISRVKSILFANNNQKEHTIASVELSTAFIPRHLVHVSNDYADFDLSSLKFPNRNNKTNWKDDIDKFNRLMGGFALMRVAGEDYMNFSENYFSTLSFFNSVISDELKVAGKHINPIFHDAFIGKASFQLLNKYLYKKILEDDLFEIATIEKQQIIKDKITRIIDLSKLDRATFIVAILNTFGTGQEAKKKRVDSLILSNFKSDVVTDKSEVISLCYGLNRGYSVLNNVYKSGNKNKVVKFKLDNQLDYYIIESLYQFAFNKTKSSAFPFLDSWCPKKSYLNIQKNKGYQILDVNVIEKKKPQVSSQAYLSSLLQKLFQKETANMFSGFLTEIRNLIYSDTLEELQETIDERDAEIDKLRKERIDNQIKQQKVEEPKAGYKQEKPENSKNKVLTALKLKSVTATEFKKIAKSNNVKIEKGYKDKDDRDRYILQIIEDANHEIPFN